MALQAIIFFVLGVVILVLVVINCFLLWSGYLVNKKINILLENGKIKDFKDVLLSQKDKNDQLHEMIKEVFLRIENLDDICERTIQKTGIVRYNPFCDMGGNQSFIIALLDDRNNGFVISSLFSNEGNRVYAKQIKQGKSEHTLIKEEIEAINKAINSK